MKPATKAAPKGTQSFAKVAACMAARARWNTVRAERKTAGLCPLCGGPDRREERERAAKAAKLQERVKKLQARIAELNAPRVAPAPAPAPVSRPDEDVSLAELTRRRH